jgi:hypothetical protein
VGPEASDSEISPELVPVKKMGLEPHTLSWIRKEGKMKKGIGLTALCLGLVALCTGVLMAQERWVYQSNAGMSMAYCVAVGVDGNVYAGGSCEDDFIVLSLTDSGTERWIYQRDGSAQANSIAEGQDGNIYAAGTAPGTVTAWDFTVIGLTPSGTERWIYRYNGPANSFDVANSVIVALDGNLYAAGYSTGIGTSDDFTVISLDTSGAERWVYRHDGSANNRDEALSVVVGLDSTVYAAGRSYGSGTYSDFTVVAITSSGEEDWIYQYDGTANTSDGANSIHIGPDGNLYAAGYSTEIGTGCDFTVISLTASGAERWVYRYDGTASSSDQANSIVMGPDNSLYAAGFSSGIGTHRDFAVVSLDTSGVERWVYECDGLPSFDDSASSIVVGLDGNLYAAGYVWGNGTNDDFTVISLTPSGAERWVYRYNWPDGLDRATSIADGPGGDIYAAGWIYEGIPADVMRLTVVAFDADLGIEERFSKVIEPPGLDISVCPTPGLRGVEISYNLPDVTEVKLSIYDVCGRLIRNLVNTTQESGPKMVVWNGGDSEDRRVPSGTYFVRLEASRSCICRKFILM